MSGVPLKQAVAGALAVVLYAGGASADTPALTLRGTLVSGGTVGQAVGPANLEAKPRGTPLDITLFRWSTDVERAPLLAALTAPVPAPEAPAASPAGRGRGGRGGRGAAQPLGPTARLAAAIRAAPTIGYVWGEAVTGYSIKYAWHASSADGTERIVLATDRRLGAHGWGPSTDPGAPGGDFTVIEVRIAADGTGEAKASLTASVQVDLAAGTLALDGYASAPRLLEIRR